MIKNVITIDFGGKSRLERAVDRGFEALGDEEGKKRCLAVLASLAAECGSMTPENRLKLRDKKQEAYFKAKETL